MTWTTHHRRSDVLREVIRAADTRCDGLLPLDVTGVAETFRDEETLLGALQLRWHARLAGRIERELADQPLDLEHAVVSAWRTAAAEMPGTRAILDHYRAEPTGPGMARAVEISTAKEHDLLALMAGVASAPGEAAQRAGRAIETAARTAYVPVPAPRQPVASLVDRLRALVA